MNRKNIFASRWGIVAAGACIGAIAPLLQYLGNPGNMGVCAICFVRDISGGLGLHRAAPVQYIRPEIAGFVLGSLLAALYNKEFPPRTGSAPIVRFFLGMCAAIGGLVFLGCPWRAMFRLAGGDGNALWGALGFIGGIGLGTLFLRRGYDLGRSQKSVPLTGLLLPAMMAALLVLVWFFPFQPGSAQSGPLWYSLDGPGAKHAPFLWSLGAGLLIGVLAQRSRFCTMGAFRDVILFRQLHLLSGILALLLAALALNLTFGQFHPGFAGQPVAHTMTFWNIAGMVVAGLAFCLAGGCPGRQLFLAGEGDGDAAVFVLGMLAGTAVAHNFGLASSPAGIGPHGAAGVAVSLAVCLIIGLTMREQKSN